MNEEELEKLTKDLMDYLVSDSLLADCALVSSLDQKQSGASVDVGCRFGLCKEIVSIRRNNFFGMTKYDFTLFDKSYLLDTLNLGCTVDYLDAFGILAQNSYILGIMKKVMESDDYKSLVKKGRGELYYTPYVGDGGTTKDKIRLRYNTGLLRSLFGSDLYGFELMEKIRALNGVDDTLYGIGDRFLKNLPELFAHYFALKKEKKDCYCFRFCYPKYFSITDISPKLAPLFDEDNCFKVGGLEELDVALGLVEL